MADEQSIHEALSRAQRAKEIIDNPLYVEAWSLINETLVKSWRNSRVAEEREEYWRYCKIADKLQGVFAGIMERGEHAAIDLQKLSEKKPRLQGLKRMFGS